MRAKQCSKHFLTLMNSLFICWFLGNYTDLVPTSEASMFRAFPCCAVVMVILGGARKASMVSTTLLRDYADSDDMSGCSVRFDCRIWVPSCICHMDFAQTIFMCSQKRKVYKQFPSLKLLVC